MGACFFGLYFLLFFFVDFNSLAVSLLMCCILADMESVNGNVSSWLCVFEKCNVVIIAAKMSNNAIMPRRSPAVKFLVI